MQSWWLEPFGWGVDWTQMSCPSTYIADGIGQTTGEGRVSPSLDRLGLATANPLLRDVVAVGGGSAPPAGGPAAGGDSSEGQAGGSSSSSGNGSGRLRVTFQPDGGMIPYQGATMEVSRHVIEATSSRGLGGVHGARAKRRGSGARARRGLSLPCCLGSVLVPCGTPRATRPQLWLGRPAFHLHLIAS